MAENDNETIELAYRGLKAAVKKYCRKKKRDVAPNIHQILEHAHYFLTMLARKRRSLKCALNALEILWKKTWCPRLANSQDVLHETTAILTHVFHQFLRLRDGMNLMTSGECRHAGDVNESKRSKFKSRLPSLAKCQDGYTSYYSCRYYSGYGWDEFQNDKVGIQHCLLNALNNGCTWEKLLNYGAQAFDSCLDTHEVESQVLQAKLDQLRGLIAKDLQTDCGFTRVSLVTLDKMERLQVTSKGSNTQISLERRGNALQVCDKEGCLPNGWDVTDWELAMQYVYEPPKQTAEAQDSLEPTTKKRRVIQDSDDEEESGLRVRVEKKKQDEIKGKRTLVEGEINVDEVNLAELKGHASARQLQESREMVEAEGAGADESQATNDNADEVSELQHEIHETKTKVERHARKLEHLLTEGRDDGDVELWICREYLREESMTLGSHLLSLCAVDSDADNHGTNLEAARDCFSKAKEMVIQMEAVHDTVVKQTNDTSDEGTLRDRRKLLLLRGRAHANLGIALVELSIEKKAQFKNATNELESALNCANAIRARAVTDEVRGSSPSEIAMDRVEADQLDSLTHRWLGNSLWHQRRREEAVMAYETSSRFFADRRQNALSDRDLLEAEISLAVDCFVTCMCLVELALDALEKLQVVAQGHPKRIESLSKGEELFAIASQAYKRASTISSRIAQVANQTCSGESIMSDKGILGPREIEAIMKESSAWWEQKKQGTVLRQNERASHVESSFLRNDLFSSGPARPMHTNPKRYIVQEGSGRRKRRRHDNTGGYSSNISSRVPGNGKYVSGDRQSKPGRLYRRWGDELLPQVKSASGKMVPKLEYPCQAPPLPPGLKPFSGSL